MISFKEALQKVLNYTHDFGNEKVTLDQCNGRILAEAIIADRDFPPFDRSTKDGIAINFDSVISPDQELRVIGMAQAGSPQLILEKGSNCIEIMTGAMVPKKADTIIMYEHVTKTENGFSINESIKKGQNIHYQASDTDKNGILLNPSSKLTAAEVGLMASVGKSEVQVKKLPKVAVISTGNELVNIDQIPEPYQIRKSNSHTLATLLGKEHIIADIHHMQDKPEIIKKTLKTLLTDFDVLLLSGGVSKGKFDYLPKVFNELGVQKVFHKVLQRPGKPFWFGINHNTKTTIFSFPGNPVSTFVNYHLYFVPWLNKTLGVDTPHFTVFLEEPMTNKTDLTLFLGVKVNYKGSSLYAQKVSSTGSGDLIGLSKVDGFVQLNPNEKVEKGKEVPIILTRNIF